MSPQAGSKTQKTKLKPSPRKEPEHGTESTYRNHKCRCDACKEAHRIRNAKQNADNSERLSDNKAAAEQKAAEPKRTPEPEVLAPEEVSDDRLQAFARRVCWESLILLNGRERSMYAKDLVKSAPKPPPVVRVSPSLTGVVSEDEPEDPQRTALRLLQATTDQPTRLSHLRTADEE